jgi:hypothetical protein
MVHECLQEISFFSANLQHTPIFEISVGGKNLRIRVLAAFPVPGWGKSCGEFHLDLRAIGGLLKRGIPAFFWQTEHYLRVFSTRAEKERFSGFSGTFPETV